MRQLLTLRNEYLIHKSILQCQKSNMLKIKRILIYMNISQYEYRWGLQKAKTPSDEKLLEHSRLSSLTSEIKQSEIYTLETGL